MIRGMAIAGDRQTKASFPPPRVPVLEIAMVTAIVVLLGGGGYMYLDSASTTQQTAEVAEELVATQKVIRTAFSGSSNYNNLTASDILDKIPTKMRSGESGMRHAFGGAVTVQAQNVGGGMGSGFSVHMDALPKGACEKLATMDTGRSTAALFINEKPFALPVNENAAKAACSGDSDSLSWLFF